MIARVLVMARFPRAAVAVEILAIAELCRSTARALEVLAVNATDYEPSALRRAAHDLARVLYGELDGHIALRAPRAQGRRRSTTSGASAPDASITDRA